MNYICYSLPTIALAAALLTTTPSLAQPASDQDQAAGLFKEGLALMIGGDYGAGCPKLVESYRFDPRAGTLFTLAECEAKAGRVATAVARYKEYLNVFSGMTPEMKEKQKGRDSVSAEQIIALELSIPRVVINSPLAAPASALVKLDGRIMYAAALGHSQPIDPGEHVVRVEAPGWEPSEQRFSIAKGEEVRIDPALDRPLPPALPSPVRVALAPAPVVAASRPSFGPAAVVGGIGLAGLAVGITATAVPSVESVNGAKNLVSAVGFGVGILGVATGTVMLLLRHDPSEGKTTTAWIRPEILNVGTSGAAVGVKGTF